MEHMLSPLQTKSRLDSNNTTAIESTTSINSANGGASVSVDNGSSVFTTSEDNNSSQRGHPQPSLSLSLPPNLQRSSSLMSRFPPWFSKRRGSTGTFESGSTMVEFNLSLKGFGEKGTNEKNMTTSTDTVGNVRGRDDESADREMQTDSTRHGSESLRKTRHGGVSTFKTIASLVCVIGGSGTLGLSHAVAESGWLGSLIIVLALFMSAYTGFVLIDCLYLKTDARRTTYQEIASDAYGMTGHYFAYGVVAVNLFGCAILYMILSATLIEVMIRTATASTHGAVYVYVIGCTAFVWCCLIFTKTMKEVALLSILGAFSTMGVVLITIGVSADQMLHGAQAVLGAHHRLVTWSKMPLSLATISFAYGGNVVYPHVEQSMLHPRSWNRALWSALSICFVMYLSIASVGYLAYGDTTLSPILNNLPQGAWSILANSLITLHVLLATPILLTSLAMMVEESISKRWPTFQQGTKGEQFLKRALPRSVIVLLVGLIASVVPFFGDVMDLLGSMTTCLLVFIMPVMFYYRLGGLRRKPIWIKAWAWFILVIGLIAMVLGTLDAVRHLINDFKRK
ncbi:solute carrier family 32 (vesicular inhibitory amino acid transporter) [Entomortierella parvispora]|uniref:Solute carrier family 32 (Vesicular inhibitory amino acid transporter) n=1 Tax=Entomortierella parvispora TaxID=205924 RepID=A0A9P3HHF8_9FUNG|nr:solute carrier family 32 (vesicular inhibitory amino acid transporter) [Entomortierella parvispora]